MKTILLADDNTTTRSALALLLSTRFEFEQVFTAVDWDGLLSTAQRQRPELILLDWELPGCTPTQGHEALRAILPDVRLIVLSARPEHRQAALAIGIQTFVSKLDAPDRLLAIIQAMQSP
jgi:DNA-binding NarL/FixJ family response regulator